MFPQAKKYKPHLIQSNLALEPNKQTRRTCYFQKLEQSCEPRDFPLKEKRSEKISEKYRPLEASCPQTSLKIS
jgi:hypothetical protein